MYPHHQQAIDRLIEQYREDPRFLAMLVGGSIAKGRAREDSDVDVNFIVSDEEFELRQETTDLWFFDPEIEWYVGASGALHGVMTAGTLAHLRRRDLDGWILAVFIIAKLSYEQFAGSMPFAGAANTVVDAHLYGAVGGFVLALCLRSRREPQ